MNKKRPAANRAGIIVRPGAKFVGWIGNADEGGGGITAEDIERGPSVDPFDDHGMDEEKNRLLAEYCKEIFEKELNGGIADESACLKTRDLKTFID